MQDHSQKETFLKSYDLYSDALFRYCFFQTSNREVALDIVQDTFTKTWEYLAHGKQVENLRAFLYRVAGNLIIDWRRKKKASSLDSMQESGFDIGFDEREHIENKIDGKQVFTLLELVDVKYKDVIIMRFIEEMTIPEIASVTGESENTISVRLHRGLEKIRKLYKEIK